MLVAFPLLSKTFKRTTVYVAEQCYVLPVSETFQLAFCVWYFSDSFSSSIRFPFRFRLKRFMKFELELCKFFWIKFSLVKIFVSHECIFFSFRDFYKFRPLNRFVVVLGCRRENFLFSKLTVLLNESPRDLLFVRVVTTNYDCWTNMTWHRANRNRHIIHCSYVCLRNLFDLINWFLSVHFLFISMISSKISKHNNRVASNNVFYNFRTTIFPLREHGSYWCYRFRHSFSILWVMFVICLFYWWE